MRRRLFCITLVVFVISSYANAGKRVISNPIDTRGIVPDLNQAQCLASGGILMVVSKRICIRQMKCHLTISTNGQTRDICISDN